MTGKRTTTDHNPAAPPERDAPAAEEKAEPNAATTSAPAEAAPKSAEQLTAELADLTDRHLRLAADFENFKKRSRQERTDLTRYASAQLAEQLLSVLDDFERVLEHAPEGLDESWLKGIHLTGDRLREVLAGAGVEPISAVGAHFDPSQHEAIGTEETAEHPEDTVVAELRRGYRIHDRVLRPAMVRIARAPSRPDDQTTE